MERAKCLSQRVVLSVTGRWKLVILNRRTLIITRIIDVYIQCPCKTILHENVFINNSLTVQNYIDSIRAIPNSGTISLNLYCLLSLNVCNLLTNDIPNKFWPLALTTIRKTTSTGHIGVNLRVCVSQIFNTNVIEKYLFKYIHLQLTTNSSH